MPYVCSLENKSFDINDETIKKWLLVQEGHLQSSQDKETTFSRTQHQNQRPCYCTSLPTSITWQSHVVLSALRYETGINRIKQVTRQRNHQST